MQSVSQHFLEGLQGSFRPVVKVDAWYDGRLQLEDVPMSSGSVTLDRSRAISGSATVTAASADDSLLPSGWDAPLAPYGSEIQIRCGIQTGAGVTEMVSLGWYRIDQSEPGEWWDTYRDSAHPERQPTWVCRGVTVGVQASDRMSRIDDARFLAPEAPASLASTIAEIKRLVRDLVPIADLSGVTDGPIPASVAYQTSRTQAVKDLADVIGMTARMNSAGALTLLPSVPSGSPVWTVKVGRDDGEIVDWGRRLDRSQLYNGVVSTGTGADGVAVQGVATEDTGPLRWDGPFGRIPFGHSSPLITTDLAAQDDAFTRLESLIRERVVPITVKCIANPALELDDIVRIQLPDSTMDGPVASIAWPLPATEMTIVVMVPRDQMWR